MILGCSEDALLNDIIIRQFTVDHVPDIHRDFEI